MLVTKQQQREQGCLRHSFLLHSSDVSASLLLVPVTSPGSPPVALAKMGNLQYFPVPGNPMSRRAPEGDE